MAKQITVTEALRSFLWDIDEDGFYSAVQKHGPEEVMSMLSESGFFTKERQRQEFIVAFRRIAEYENILSDVVTNEIDGKEIEEEYLNQD